jgi:hypothetical protein
MCNWHSCNDQQIISFGKCVFNNVSVLDYHPHGQESITYRKSNGINQACHIWKFCRPLPAFSDVLVLNVEGEVYATSSFYRCFLGHAEMGRESTPVPSADNWIILIAYLMGLSIGVHLLNLLTISTRDLLFKKHPATVKGFLSHF